MEYLDKYKIKTAEVYYNNSMESKLLLGLLGNFNVTGF